MLFLDVVALPPEEAREVPVVLIVLLAVVVLVGTILIARAVRRRKN